MAKETNPPSPPSPATQILPVEFEGERFTLLSSYIDAQPPRWKYLAQEWENLEKEFGDFFFPAVLYLLTRQRFEEQEAKTHWHNIIEHQKGMSQKLQRDPGLQVALTDYFSNSTAALNDGVLVDAKFLAHKEALAVFDELTGLYNRRFFEQALKREMDNADRFREPFALLMIDVDHFKEFNDSYGHLAGDQALAELARLLCSTCRSADYVVRYGGEEFATLLPRIGRDHGILVAERQRLIVGRHNFSPAAGDDTDGLTVSVGVASFPRDGSGGRDILQAADGALYRAKNQGRNRVASFGLEQRRHVRLPLPISVVFRPAGSCSDFDIKKARNVSAGGMALQTSKQIQQGERLELIIQDSVGRPLLNLVARTAWVTKAQGTPDQITMGLSFEMRDQSAQAMLMRLLEELILTPK